MAAPLGLEDSQGVVRAGDEAGRVAGECQRGWLDPGFRVVVLPGVCGGRVVVVQDVCQGYREVMAGGQGESGSWIAEVEVRVQSKGRGFGRGGRCVGGQVVRGRRRFQEGGRAVMVRWVCLGGEQGRVLVVF